MPIELARADVEFLVNGRSFTVDAYEADLALAKIDAKYADTPGSSAAGQEQRWLEVAAYVNRRLKLWWFQRSRRCTLKQAINFYRGVQEALGRLAEEDAKRAHPFAASPTGTASTPAASANESSPPTSPTSTASKPSES